MEYRGQTHSFPERRRGGGMGSMDRGRVPWGFLGMLGLMALVELALARHGLAPSNWRASGRAASGKAVGCEVLCFGDSQVKLGLLPRVIEQRLGRPAYNLAIVGGQAPA